MKKNHSFPLSLILEHVINVFRVHSFILDLPSSKMVVVILLLDHLLLHLTIHWIHKSVLFLLVRVTIVFLLDLKIVIIYWAVRVLLDQFEKVQIPVTFRIPLEEYFHGLLLVSSHFLAWRMTLWWDLLSLFLMDKILTDPLNLLL